MGPPASAAANLAPPSFADLCRGPYGHVRVEPGPRMRDSWRVAWNGREPGLRLRVPPSLFHAPGEVKESLLRWAVVVSRRRRRRDAADRLERRLLEERIRSHLKAAEAGGDPPGSPLRERRLAANARRLDRLNVRGRHHNLQEALDRVNAEYFGGALEARITWAARLGGLSTHRIAEDGEGRPYHLLTISRGYDSPEVTPEILGGVVYHECLHIAIPPRMEGGKRVMHGRDFRLRERQYRHYREWREWHRTGLPKALRRMFRERGGS